MLIQFKEAVEKIRDSSYKDAYEEMSAVTAEVLSLLSALQHWLGIEPCDEMLTDIEALKNGIYLSLADSDGSA